MSDAALAPDETVDLGELAGSIGFLLRIAQLRAFAAFYDQMAPHGIKPGEFTVLFVIGRNPGVRQGTVARQLSIKPAHMTKLVQRLVAKGFVARAVPGADRRVVTLSLTRAGQGFVAAHRDMFLGLQGSEGGSLSPAQQAGLIRLLRKFNDLPA